MNDQEWFDSLSDDPEEPSLIVIAHAGDIMVFDDVMTVLPGERLRGYRTKNGVVFVGFDDVLVH